MDDRNNNNNNKGNMPGGKGPKGGQTLIVIMIAFIVTILGMSCLNSVMYGSTSKKIKYSEFLTMIEEGKVLSVKYESDKIVIHPKEPSVLSRKVSKWNHTFLIRILRYWILF